MDGYRLLLWLHLIAVVLLSGLSLFWALMQLAPGSAGERRELVEAAARARWPHVGVPVALRLPLPLLTLAASLAVLATGLLAAGRLAPDPWFHLKLAAFVLLLLLQLGLLRRRSGVFTLGQLPLVLLAVLFAALWVRS